MKEIMVNVESGPTFYEALCVLKPRAKELLRGYIRMTQP
jgi:hypothetical protein